MTAVDLEAGFRPGAARILWSAVVVLAAATTAATGWYLLARGDCHDTFVRLLDYGPVLLVLALVAVVGGVVGLLLALRPGRHRVLAGVAGVALVPLVLASAVGVSLAVEDVGAAQDPVCWTM